MRWIKFALSLDSECLMNLNMETWHYSRDQSNIQVPVTETCQFKCCPLCILLQLTTLQTDIGKTVKNAQTLAPYMWAHVVFKCVTTARNSITLVQISYRNSLDQIDLLGEKKISQSDVTVNITSSEISKPREHT